jgi:3',5'-nucleoside bisphosphate phosphatase
VRVGSVKGRAGFDLHLHTTASDGSLSPAELVRAAVGAGVTLLAVTDHDTTEGVAEAVAAGREVGARVVPGVELSVDTDEHDIHLLGFYLQWEDDSLQESLRQLRQRRVLRNARILDKLHALGLPLDPARVKALGGPGSVGRPHIARAMIERGYVSTQGEAFYRYLARGKPAFAPRVRFSCAEACAMITRARGVSVLAHPAKIGSWPLVEELLASGVEGLEVYHTDHDQAVVQRLLSLARAKGLLVTGGTDSHGPRSDRASEIGSVAMPAWVRERFLARAPGWWS